MIPNTTYYFRVAASNVAGLNQGANIVSFPTKETPPPIPVLASPSNRATGVSTNPSLTWDASSGAASYQLQVSTSSNFTTLFVEQNVTSGTSHRVSNLGTGTTYYWRVNASNDAATSSWSEVWWFTTAPVPPEPPSPPTLSAPGNGATGISTNPTLRWSASDRATSYTLQVSLGSSFSSFVFAKAGIAATSLVVTDLLENTTYFWRVNASNAAGASNWSDVWPFTTGIQQEHCEYAPDANTVLLLHMNESSGSSISDASASGNNATAKGTSIAQGRFGNARTFNGTSDWVDCGNGVSFQLAGTAEGWINLTSYPPPGFISFVVGKYDGSQGDYTLNFHLGIDSDGKLLFRIGSVATGDLKGNLVVPLNQWTHVAATFDGSIASGNMKLYMNGVFDASWDRLGNAPSNPAPLLIGKRNPFEDHAFFGLIDEIRISNKARSADEFNLSCPSLPLPPSLISPSSNAMVSADLTLSWNASTGATSYGLQVSSNSDFSSLEVNQSGITATSYSVPAGILSNGTTYFWRVNAWNPAGSTDWSSPWSFTTIVPSPSSPTAFDVTNVTSTGFTANWSAVNEATSYRLDVATDNVFASPIYSSRNVGNVVSHKVTGLTANTTYYYRVTAVNAGGTSANSNTIRVTTTPAAPTALEASNVTSSGFTAVWNAVTGATGYRLDVANDDAFTMFVLGYQDLPATGTTKVVTDLTPKTTYYYRVRAVNGSGSSPNSNIVTVTTHPIVPSVPRALAATNVASTSFRANWNAVDGATSYRLDVSPDNFATFVIGYNNLTVIGTSQLVLGLTANTVYWYRVRAVNSGGTSPNSNTIEATTLVGVPRVLTISPTTSDRGQTLSVSITGTNFFGGITSVAFGAGIRVNSVTIPNSTQLTANITIAISAAAGFRDVSVTNSGLGGGTAVLTDAFTVTNPVPGLSSLSPNRGGRGSILNVTLAGTNFFTDVTTVSFGSDISVNSKTVNTTTQMTVNITIPSTATIGGRDVTITNSEPGGGTAKLPNSFTVDTSPPTEVYDFSSTMPKEYVLYSSYPNPFNPSTTVRFGLPERSHVKIEIINVLGRVVTELVNGDVEQGYHQFVWNASGFPSGVYIIRMQAEGPVVKKKFVASRKTILLK